MREEHIAKAHEHLAEHGWALIRGWTWETSGEIGHSQALEMASRFGRPSSRDGGPVWEVRPRSGHEGATFSERAGTAPFHTDAQYHPVPEDLVCLFVVRPADDGGHTRLLTAADALSALRRAAYGDETRAALAQERWSWRVPATFHNSGTTAVSPPATVIAADGSLRWRRDNLVAPDARGEACAARFAACLATSPDVVEVVHYPGDLIVLDNRRVLHARGPFRDPRRLLLRVRLWTS